MSWWERVGIGDFKKEVFRAHGIDIVSEIVGVESGKQEDGEEFLAVRVRNSNENNNTENVATCYMRESISPDQFQQSVRSSREWFADQFAQECLGIAPRRATYWAVAISNPSDPSKRIQGLGVFQPDLPTSLIMRGFCEPLGLAVRDDRCQVLIRIFGKRFLANLTAADIPILAVIGNDLINRAIADDSDRNSLLESVFLDPAARAYVVRRNAKAKSVLALGSYGEEGIKRLRFIEGHLFKLGYDPVLLADYPTEAESLEAKMMSFAAISRFVVYDATFPSEGAAAELSLCKNNDIVTAVIYQEGRSVNSVQQHYPIGHPLINYFSYCNDTIIDTLKQATQWADKIVETHEQHYKVLNKTRGRQESRKAFKTKTE